MPEKAVFTIIYWGVTGTVAAPLKPGEVTDKIAASIHHLLQAGKLADLKPGPGSEHAVRRLVADELPFELRSTFGGNTTCVEVQTPDALVILDCGTGCRALGIDLQSRWNAPGYQGDRSAHILLTHAHMDHTLTMPYVDAFFDAANHLTVWGPRTVLDALSAILSGKSPLSQTFFPPTFEVLKAIKDFRELPQDAEFTIGSTRIAALPLRHPGGCLAYRLENSGRKFVFATDHEHAEVPDLALADFARAADLFYTDGQYLAAEYDGEVPVADPPACVRHGWGHSPVEACVATAVAAGVRRLHVGHREPKRSDANTARLEQHVQQLLREELRRAGRNPDACTALVPYEGLTVKL